MACKLIILRILLKELYALITNYLYEMILVYDEFVAWITVVISGQLSGNKFTIEKNWNVVTNNSQ